MSKYRKKPMVIEAFRLGVDYIPDWFMDAVTANEVILHGNSSGFDHYDDTNADIHTLEGWHHANYGDYIIRGVKGELYPCKTDIFDMTYEAVDRPKTNADRIRSMTDEQLEKIVKLIVGYDHCLNKADCEECPIKNLCFCCEEGHELEWLRQPAEERKEQDG